MLQGCGGDVVVAALFSDQLQLQLQPIQLRPHLSNLLLQSSQLGAIILHFCKLFIYYLCYAGWNAQL